MLVGLSFLKQKRAGAGVRLSCSQFAFPRIHASEYCESDCLGEVLRFYLFAALKDTQNRVSVLSIIHQLFRKQLLADWPSNKVVELGSGSGEMIRKIAPQFLDDFSGRSLSPPALRT